MGSDQPRSVSAIRERRSDLLLACRSAHVCHCVCFAALVDSHAFECLFLTGSSPDCLTSFCIYFQHQTQSLVQPPFVYMTCTLQRSLPKLSNNLEFSRYSFFFFFSFQMKTFA